MRRHLFLPIALATGTVLAGCANAAPARVANPSSAPAAASPSPSLSPTPAQKDRGLTLGTTAKATEHTDITVFAYRVDSAPAEEPRGPGQTWASVDAQACVRPTVTA